MANNKQQTAVDIKEELKSILGADAFSLGNMQVSERVTKLVKAVKYMDTQLQMLDRWIEDEQGKEHIIQARQTVKNILNETQGQQMISFIKTYIKYVLFHKWNKLSKESFDLLDNNWKNKPTKGLNLWLYNKIKKINGYNK